MNQELYQKVADYYKSCRHYNDETAAYPLEMWENMMASLYKAFENMYVLERESGNTVIRADLSDEKLEEIYKDLKDADEAMEALHNPESDKIYLWKEQNMPWDQIDEEEWDELTFDAEDFRPHLTKHLVDDGKIHPAVIICGGRYRCNGKEGRPIAELLVKNGYHAFILNNRMGCGEKIRHSLERSLDLQRAIRIIRCQAEQLHVDPMKIAFWGLSMGNRPAIDLINRLGYQSNPHDVDDNYYSDEIDNLDATLNAYISEYPATFPWEAPNNYAGFPPVFGVMGNRDFSIWRVMPFFTDLIINKCALELHIYDGVSHGFGTGDYRFETGDSPLAKLTEVSGDYVKAREEWTLILFLWMERVFSDDYTYKWPIEQLDN